MQNLYRKNIMEEKNSSKITLILFFILLFFFAYLVAKEISLPDWLILFLGIVGTGILFLKCLSKPEFGLYVLAVYIPFSKILVGDFGGIMRALNLTNILVICILIGWFFKSRTTGQPFWEKSSLNLLIYLFIFVGFISVLRASLWAGSDFFIPFIVKFKRWITPVLFYFLAYNIAKERHVIKTLTYIIMVAVFIVSLMAIRDYMNVGQVSSLEKARVGGICQQPNQLAAFFVYYMFLYAGFILMNMFSLRHWLLFLPMLSAFRGIMVTFSRGGYIAFACGALGIVFFRSKFLLILLSAILVLAILNPVLLPSGIRYRMGMTIAGSIQEAEDLKESLDASARRRIEAWKGALRMIETRPLLGFGYGLFPYYLPYFVPELAKGMDAHNTYLIMAAEQGIFSVILFLLIVLTIMKNANWVLKNSDDKFYKALALGFLGGLAGLLMANMFGSRLNTLEISGYFWILAGMVMRIKTITNSWLINAKQKI